MRKIFSLALLLSVLTINSPAFAASTKTHSFADVIDDLLPSVVNISTTKKVVDEYKNSHSLQFPQGSPFEEFLRQFNRENEQHNSEKSMHSLGSGFIISEDGYIVTNAHVIEDAEIIEIKFSDNSTATASIVGVDVKSDLALLKIETDKKLPPITFGNSDLARVGDWAIAIGNPFGLGSSVSVGIISARGRDIEDAGYTAYIQTDAAINKGSSGGPLFNSEGKLIGINTAIFSNSGGNIGIGFAIPSQTALPIIAQLKSQGHVTRGWLGVSIQLITDDIAKALGLEKAYGAYVINVTPNSPASAANIQSDDIIIEFDKQKIEHVKDLPKIVGNTKVGKKTKVKLLRLNNGVYYPITVTVEVGKYEEQDKQEEQAQQEAELPEIESIIGLNIVNLSDEIRSSYGISDKVTNGIMIIDFNDELTASMQGVEIGDVIVSANQTEIMNIEQFKQVVSEAKASGKNMIITRITRAEGTFIMPLNISSYKHEEDSSEEQIQNN